MSERPAGKMARKPSSPNAKYCFAVEAANPERWSLVGEKNNQARRKISGGPAESAEQGTCVRFRDSRFLVYFALDSRRKSFRRRQNNATFLAIESEAAPLAPAPVCCAVFRAGHAR